MIQRYYFKNPKSIENILGFKIFNFCNVNTKAPFLFKKEIFYSKKINLNNSIDEIFKNFKSNTRNEIRKSQNFDIKFSQNIDRSLFVKIYNDNAKALKRPKLILDKLESNLVITGSVINNNICSIHAYLVHENHFSMLLYSVLNYNSNQESKLLGYFNRFHHYEDIKYFKSLKFKIYDFGGYAINSNDIKLKAINKFKDSFGGELIKYHNFNSPLIILLRTLIKIKN
tara:strand:+ start:5406 stop:6086 length:681 start_codon:yes stop_codon:yes gene_type:complete